MTDEFGGTSSAAEWSSSPSLDHDDHDATRTTAGRRRPEKLTDIRDWLAAVFARSVKVGERLLEDGHVAEAAVTFANATLLTDRGGAFAAGVRRVYPSYFYRLFERRMIAMGFGHLFAADPTTTTSAAATTTTTTTVDACRPPRRGSPVDSGRRRGRHGRTVGPDSSSSSDRDDTDTDKDDDGKPPDEKLSPRSSATTTTG